MTQVRVTRDWAGPAPCPVQIDGNDVLFVQGKQDVDLEPGIHQLTYEGAGEPKQPLVINVLTGDDFETVLLPIEDEVGDDRKVFGGGGFNVP